MELCWWLFLRSLGCPFTLLLNQILLLGSLLFLFFGVWMLRCHEPLIDRVKWRKKALFCHRGTRMPMTTSQEAAWSCYCSNRGCKRATCRKGALPTDSSNSLSIWLHPQRFEPKSPPGRKAAWACNTLTTWATSTLPLINPFQGWFVRFLFGLVDQMFLSKVCPTLNFHSSLLISVFVFGLFCQSFPPKA